MHAENDTHRLNHPCLEMLEPRVLLSAVLDATEIIVDNLSGGFSTTGKWQESKALDEYAGSSMHTNQIGATALWQPDLPEAGTYEAWAWWAAAAPWGGTLDRDSAADYTVHYDGGTETVTVDQNVRSGQWICLGTFNFAAGTAGYVELARDSAGGIATSADAMKFIAVAPNGDIVVDNLSAGFSTTGKWMESKALDEYAGSSAHTNEIGSTATWTPKLPEAGTYEAWAWWAAEAPWGGTLDRDSAADYTIHYNGGTETVTVDQNMQSGQWILLGTYDFAAGREGYVTLMRDSANGIATSADAVKFVRVSAPQMTVTVDPLTTSDPTPKLTGKVSDALATVSVQVNGVIYDAVNHGNGIWTLADNTLAPLAIGTYDVAVTARDSYGNDWTDQTLNELTIVPPPVSTTPTLVYDVTDLGDGLYGYTFFINNNDGKLLSNGLTVGFSAALQTGAFGGAVVVNRQDEATLYDGMDPNYDKALDSWVFNPFALNGLPGINPLTGTLIVGGFLMEAGGYAISVGSGPGSMIGDGVPLVYIVADADGGIFEGVMARDGILYMIYGTYDLLETSLSLG
jgi:hypothetical protein